MGLFDSKEVKEAKRQYKEEMRQLANSMQPTGKIFMCAKWDDNLGVISISNTIIKYNTIRDVQVFEEVKAVTQTQGKEKKKGGITRALVGGVVAGPVGAIVGGMTAKTENNATSITSQQVTRTLVVTRDDPFNTVLSLPYNAKLEVKLRDILAANTTPAVETTTVEQIESQPVSIADEIVKLKELLDAGILTDEEFATQKAKLLK
ncbi:MAG: SHOCT domain-containing protein [Bacteroidales bacterium]|nr:SHOCT domain-containing protein [Bacteroidales bacterium]